MGILFAEITIAVELIVIALGFIVFHYYKKEQGHLLKVAAYILIFGGSLLLVGTGFRLASVSMGNSRSSMWQGHHMGMGSMQGRRGGNMRFRPYDKMKNQSERPQSEESK